MLLVNAIYFNGIWQYEFEKEKTEDKVFYLADGSSIQVPTMIQEASFNYLQNDLFRAVELPYGNGDFSMIILLPNFEKSIMDILNAMDEGIWDNWLSSFTMSENVQVELPKFKYQYGTKLLNNELIEMGLGIAFSDNADFSKICDIDIYISRVLHKAFIDVNEVGTEAAAATIVEMTNKGISDIESSIIYFKVDKPFIFAIKEKQTNAILFMGRVMSPIIEN